LQDIKGVLLFLSIFHTIPSTNQPLPHPKMPPLVPHGAHYNDLLSQIKVYLNYNDETLSINLSVSLRDKTHFKELTCPYPRNPALPRKKGRHQRGESPNDR
jgi:hypothetical protein